MKVWVPLLEQLSIIPRCVPTVVKSSWTEMKVQPQKSCFYMKIIVPHKKQQIFPSKNMVCHIF